MAKPVFRRGEGRARVLEAALALFADHGISGTSLHMIAETLGVTKAAVYYQFQNKDDIVLAVFNPVFEQMATFIAAAQARASRAAQLDAALVGLVDLVVDHRRIVAVLRGDPAVTRFVQAHEPFLDLIARLHQLLAGEDPGPSVQIAVAMMGGGLMLSGADPDLADLGDETMRRELLHLARALLGASAGR